MTLALCNRTLRFHHKTLTAGCGPMLDAWNTSHWIASQTRPEFGGQQSPALVGQIEQDGRKFKQCDAGTVVHQHRNTPVRIQTQKFRLPVLAFFDPDVSQVVRQAQFFQCNGDFEAVNLVATSPALSMPCGPRLDTCRRRSGSWSMNWRRVLIPRRLGMKVDGLNPSTAFRCLPGAFRKSLGLFAP